MTALRRATTLTTRSWGVIIGMTLLLMGMILAGGFISGTVGWLIIFLGVPFVLAFVTAFYTPQVGISCRTLTFTIYTITQFCQIVLWLSAYAGAPEEGTCPPFLRKGGILSRSGFYTPPMSRPCDHATLYSPSDRYGQSFGMLNLMVLEQSGRKFVNLDIGSV